MRREKLGSRPGSKKRSREEIGEIKGKLINWANRRGGVYQPIAANEVGQNEEIKREPEVLIEDPERDVESPFIRGDNLPLVDLRSCNMDGKEARYVQINQIVGAATKWKKATENTIRKTEMDLMLDLNTMITKSIIDAKLNRVNLTITRNGRELAPEGYKQLMDGLSMEWGLIFKGDKIIVPNELIKRLLDTLHCGHAVTTKIAEEA